MASPTLDDAAGVATQGASLLEFAVRCSAEVDAAVAAWPVAGTTPDGTGVVRCGRAAGGDAARLSIMWSQDLPDPTGQLRAAIKSMCQSDQLGEHAGQWDQTFAGVELLGNVTGGDTSAAGGERLEAPPSVVHWKFNAAPLSDRDLVYVIAAAVTESGAQVTYGYASVRDGWVASVLGKPVPGTGRVRSRNLFPSCDRVTTLADGQVRIEHLITTSIGGWIPRAVFNTVFKPKLIEANVHEAAAFKEHALKTAAELAASAHGPTV